MIIPNFESIYFLCLPLFLLINPTNRAQTRTRFFSISLTTDLFNIETTIAHENGKEGKKKAKLGEHKTHNIFISLWPTRFSYVLSRFYLQHLSLALPIRCCRAYLRTDEESKIATLDTTLNIHFLFVCFLFIPLLDNKAAPAASTDL